MLNNVVLDVAIGLIFIFMLYSLLATTIKEFVAIIFSYRSRMLERGIEQMLDGRNFSYYWWDKLCNRILFLIQKEKIEIQNDKLPPELREEKDWRKRWALFKSRQKINPAKTYSSRKTPKKYVKRRKLNKKAELFAANITTHALYKRSAENSLFFKKPAYLSSDTFSDILIDILSKEKNTPNGTPVLMKDIASFVNEKLGENTELKKILNIYIEQANGDLQRFKLLVENWYDATMNRVSGWYKKQAATILFVIGLTLAFAFNVSTIDIVETLSDNETIREAVVKNASDYVKNRVEPETIKRDTNQQKQKENSLPKKEQVPIDSTAKNQPDTAKKGAEDRKPGTTTSPADSTNNDTPIQSNEAVKKDSLFAEAKKYMTDINKLYNESLNPNNNLLGLGWGDYGFTTDTIQYAIDSIQYTADIIKYKIDSVRYIKDSILFSTNKKAYCKEHMLVLNKCKAPIKPAQPTKPAKPTKRKSLGKLWYIFWESISHWKRLLGFIITALAISLGAPFWFDLLNKFINMRVSGKKPDEAAAAESKSAMLNRKPNPTAKG